MASIATNRRAYHDYEINRSDILTVGIVLTGSEVKAIRDGHINIGESYVSADNGELFLVNAHIDVPLGTNMGNIVKAHEPRRRRKLLARSREIARIAERVNKERLTCIALEVFRSKGLIKLNIVVAKGKNNVDKRQDLKERDWKKEQGRLLRAKGW